MRIIIFYERIARAVERVYLIFRLYYNVLYRSRRRALLFLRVRIYAVTDICVSCVIS